MLVVDLIWTRAPLLFRNAFVAADGLTEQRPARPDEVKRLGEHAVVIKLRMGDAAVEAAARAEESKLLLGPYANAETHQSSPGRDRSVTVEAPQRKHNATDWLLMLAM